MLQVAVLSVFVCMLVGVPLGLFSSYTGGLVDRFASLIMDSVYAFPGFGSGHRDHVGFREGRH